MGFAGLLAHAAPISYRFPIPIWIYVVAAGCAVLGSAPAAALAVREEAGRSWRSRDLYPALRPLRLGAIGLVLVTVPFVWGLGGGFGGTSVESREFFENPITVLVWVDFWVLLGLVSAFIGNLWDFVSPLNWTARLLDRTLAARDAPVRRYPERLGRWPAVVLLLVWSWMELIWDQAKEPRTLAAFAVGYVVATLVGTAIFGAAAWLENVEVFTVIARTFGRFAPLELRPANPDT